MRKTYPAFVSPRWLHLWGAFLCLLPALLLGQTPPESAAVVARLDTLLADRTLPFAAGEELHYKIGWGVFAVGTAVITAEQTTYAEAPAWKLSMAARTNSFADKFYKVRNSAYSITPLDLQHSLNYVSNQREGDNEKDTTFEFDWSRPAVRYHNLTDQTTREWIPVPERVYDVIALTYLLRTLPLAPNQQVTVPTTNGKEVMLSEVSVRKREEKKFRIGRYDTILVEPSVRDLGGVFKKSDGASIYFWFSDDERRLPLRMESEVSVGSFWVELEKVVLADGTVIENEGDTSRRSPRRR